MRAPARVFTDRAGIDGLIDEARSQDWSAMRQLINVTTLPGIVRAGIAMADVHPGYDFPIGGVVVFDPGLGVVSTAGAGFDINCGMRTQRTPLNRQDIAGRQLEVLN
jgi:tRNA-splicing ligase RtcB